MWRVRSSVRHAQPEVNTNTIAVNTARSSVTAVPPPCGLGRTAGISGCTISHNSSGTSRRDSESDQPATMSHQRHQSHEARRRPSTST